MRKMLKILQQSAAGLSKALGDADLLRVIQSELRYELSNDPPIQGISRNLTLVVAIVSDQSDGLHTGSLKNFILEKDDPQTQDVVLRGRHGVAQDIAVSALLGPQLSDDSVVLFTRLVLMKVCIAKPGSKAVLQFDCRVFGELDRSVFSVYNAFYLKDLDSLKSSIYRGPQFRSVDPALHKGFREFLGIRGVDTELTNFLLLHLHKKEQNQYIKWLQRLESMAAISES